MLKIFHKPTLQSVAQRKLDEVEVALFNAHSELESVQAHIAMLEQRRSRLKKLSGEAAIRKEPQA